MGRGPPTIRHMANRTNDHESQPSPRVGAPIVVFKKRRADGTLPGNRMSDATRAALKAEAQACMEPLRSPARRLYMEGLAARYGVPYSYACRAAERFVAD